MEVLQENFVTALMGLAKPSGVVLHRCSSAGQAYLEDPLRYLQVPVDEPVGFKVIIVLPKRVDELLGHLHVESNTARVIIAIPARFPAGRRPVGQSQA